MIGEAFKKISNMSKKDRMLLLCELAVREQMGVLSFEGQLELLAIRMLRRLNGEEAEVRRDNEKLPPEDRLPYPEEIPI